MIFDRFAVKTADADTVFWLLHIMEDKQQELSETGRFTQLSISEIFIGIICEIIP